MGKVFVKITAEHDLNGQIKPIAINWEDGRIFPIDKIIDVRRAASLKAGGQGMRYTCRVQNRIFFLFNDNGHWFIETDKVG
jgi:hypothetical protein